MAATPPHAALSETPTLDDVRAFIGAIAATLDPSSRYVPELLEIVDRSSRIGDLVRRLDSSSRGARHAGPHVFARMTLEQKLRCNLITNETVLFRFTEGEWDVLVRKLITRFADRAATTRPAASQMDPWGDQSGRPPIEDGGRVLCAPCSHGEEAFSVAAACLQLGLPFRIDGVDIQSECIAEARTGRMTMGFPAHFLQTPAIVGPAVLERVHFAVADLLREPGEPGALPRELSWDLIVCRNFLGYFKEEIAVDCALRLANRIDKGGALFVDSFCVGKFPRLVPALAGIGLAREDHYPVFVRAS